MTPSQRYNAKLDPAIVTATLTSRKSTMDSRFAAAALSAGAIVSAVKAILASNGVVSTEYIYYEAFARKVAKLHSRYQGANLNFEIYRLLYRWATGRGFSFSVLNAIINSVFSIVSETPLVPALNTPADHATNVAKAGNLVYHEPASGWYDKSELLLVKHSDDSVVLDVIGGPGTAAGSMITTAYSGLAAGTVYDWTVTYSNSSGTSGFAQRDFTTITP
jgi:hypothetical protein